MSVNINVKISLKHANAICTGTDPVATTEAIAASTKAVVEALQLSSGVKRKTDGDSVTQVAPAAKAAKVEKGRKVKVDVRDLNGKAYEIALYTSDTVMDLKYLLQDRVDRGAEQMRLMLAGRIMYSDLRLEDVRDATIE